MKTYYSKIYKANGDYISTLKDVNFSGFRKQINGGLGELVFTIPKKFDDFDEDYLIKLNNQVELWVSDSDTGSDGIRIYSGFISRYEPFINNGAEGVTIRCLGYVSKLATSILKHNTYIELQTDSSAGLKDSVGGSASACEIKTIIKAIIDRHQSDSNNPKINYSSTSVESCGNTLTYSFTGVFYLEALTKCLEAAPTNWYWYIGADNIIKFQGKPNQATHTFMFGKDFKNIKIEKNMESVVNSVLVSNNDTILKRFKDNTSIDSFDDRWEIKSDERVTDSTTATNMGDSALAEKKDADVRVVVEILDNNGAESGYDIESIQPGNTCRFTGFNDTTSEIFSNNMFIKGVDYTPDMVILEIESLKPSIARELANTTNKVYMQESTNRLKTYT